MSAAGSRRRSSSKGAAVAVAAVLAVMALPAPAGAVLSGTNGRILFTSGRAGGDAAAQLYIRTTIGDSGGGTVSGPFTPLGGQSRHGSWSPDRTKFVFANGTATGNLATENYDLFVKDMVDGTVTPLDIGEIGDSLSSDHPAWSPDGTRIAYEHQTVDNSANRDIMVKTVGTSAAAVNLTNDAQTELKAAWSPDSQTIYYAKQNASLDIEKRPAGGGSESAVLSSATADEYQPSVSPDGNKLCYTQQSTVGNSATADIEVVDLPTPGTPTPIAPDSTKGDINCVWSPDQTLIAFANGTFSTAQLVMARSDGSSLAPIPLEQDSGADNFDGNPDWAPDGRPVCPNTTVTVPKTKPVTIQLPVCVDTGPAYEQTPVQEAIANDGAPTHGTVGPVTQGDPSTVSYNPDDGFKGNDTVKVIGFDDFGFGSDRGKVTIHVTGKPVLSDLELNPSKFSAAKHGGSVVPAKQGKSKVSYKLSQDATVKFRVLRRGAGRKVGGKCRKKTSSNSGAKHCDLLLDGSFNHAGKAGKNRFGFSGRLKHHRLSSGSYYLRATATDPFGRHSNRVRAKFTIKPS